MDLLDDIYTYEQINNFNVLQKLVSKEDKFWSSLITTPSFLKFMVFLKPLNLIFCKDLSSLA